MFIYINKGGIINMQDKSKVIFGNVISDKDYNKAVKSKKKYAKKFGDDSDVSYNTIVKKNDRIGDSLGVYDIFHLTQRRVLSLEISVWDSVIIEFRWLWHQLLSLWDIHHIGWI